MILRDFPASRARVFFLHRINERLTLVPLRVSIYLKGISSAVLNSRRIVRLVRSFRGEWREGSAARDETAQSRPLNGISRRNEREASRFSYFFRIIFSFFFSGHGRVMMSAGPLMKSV